MRKSNYKNLNLSSDLKFTSASFPWFNQHKAELTLSHLHFTVPRAENSLRRKARTVVKSPVNQILPPNVAGSIGESFLLLLGDL